MPTIFVIVVSISTHLKGTKMRNEKETTLADVCNSIDQMKGEIRDVADELHLLVLEARAANAKLKKM